MFMTKQSIQFVLCLLIGSFIFVTPTAVFAQEVEPPTVLTSDFEPSDDDILVFEPQLFFELPFMQGFKISFNFGISLQVPRRLWLVTTDAYNFFLNFRSYVIPAQDVDAAP
jgi:hypothetical protein